MDHHPLLAVQGRTDVGLHLAFPVQHQLICSPTSGPCWTGTTGGAVFRPCRERPARAEGPRAEKSRNEIRTRRQFMGPPEGGKALALQQSGGFGSGDSTGPLDGPFRPGPILPSQGRRWTEST